MADTIAKCARHETHDNGCPLCAGAAIVDVVAALRAENARLRKALETTNDAFKRLAAYDAETQPDCPCSSCGLVRDNDAALAQAGKEEGDG